jgi:hypothetical protein
VLYKHEGQEQFHKCYLDIKQQTRVRYPLIQLQFSDWQLYSQEINTITLLLTTMENDHQLRSQCRGSTFSRSRATFTICYRLAGLKVVN